MCAEGWEALGAKLVAIVPETQRAWATEHMDKDVLVLGDHTGAFKKWFNERPTPMIFLRPDRFVAGACLHQHGPATLAAILDSMGSATDHSRAALQAPAAPTAPSAPAVSA
ncbi:hypothetical protein [Paeniglutamicibacter sp. Y32M11]|uniref:hypothetical protein n=1 Tax=Paeniglutamicibacter sp. Y32M11 TaxID=2853258 RepID=UPI001C52C502|nr:hypothetical protein [Paeniglutamicibacter sp. Y32M11]QXQ09774.1 hypothetical protein KUF55_15175 [Paeniglutamicibacter sp. Y32M11]